MSHQVYPPIVVVNNIVDGFYKHRGLRPAPRGLAPDREPAACTSDAVVSEMERFAYMRLDALADRPRGKRDWTVFLILSDSGKYAHHGPDLRGLIKGVEAEQATKDGRLSELIVIAEEGFFDKKNVMDVVRERRRKARTGAVSGPDPDGIAPFYSAHPYHNFVLVVPEHVSVGRHTIMSEEEVKDFLAAQRLQRSSLSVLLTNEALAVWLGAREGQYVRVEYDSQIAAKGNMYLRVEQGTD
jgi:DNA-directed RNA polymerase subunit H (RpoH/RPB5)